MPTYVVLHKFTEKGASRVRDSRERLNTAKLAVSKLGGQIRAFYLTMGQYDAVTIVDFPDDITAAAVSLAVGARGFYRSETLRAFDEEEHKQIIDVMPG